MLRAKAIAIKTRLLVANYDLQNSFPFITPKWYDHQISPHVFHMDRSRGYKLYVRKKKNHEGAIRNGDPVLMNHYRKLGNHGTDMIKRTKKKYF